MVILFDNALRLYSSDNENRESVLHTIENELRMVLEILFFFKELSGFRRDRLQSNGWRVILLAYALGLCVKCFNNEGNLESIQ